MQVVTNMLIIENFIIHHTSDPIETANYLIAMTFNVFKIFNVSYLLKLKDEIEPKILILVKLVKVQFFFILNLSLN